MSRPVVYEYDPASGKIIANELPADLLPPEAAHAAATQPLQPYKLKGPQVVGLAPPLTAVAPARRLGDSGKAKVRKYVAEATSLDELADIEAALDKGQLSAALAAKLQFVDADFITESAVQHSPAAPPLGAMSLSAAGLLKVRQAIADAKDMETLSILDTALTRGDIATLRDLLLLEEGDLQEEAGAKDARESEESDGDEYDPFATGPANAPTPKPGVLATLEGAYEDSDDEASQSVANVDAASQQKVELPQRKRRKKAKVDKLSDRVPPQKKLQWPLEWAWLMGRTQRHSDFRAPAFVEGVTQRAEGAAADGTDAGVLPSLVSVATSLVYAGDPIRGYDARHVARVAAVDASGAKLLDVIVKPRSGILDYRTHLTGLSCNSFESGNEVAIDTAISMFLATLKPNTIIIGHRLNSDLEAMSLWHGPIVDVSLIYGVEARQQHRYHPLWYIAEQILDDFEPRDERSHPHDALEDAHLALRLAIHESLQAEPTPAFPSRQGNPCELTVRHIPREWAADTPARLAAICPGAEQNVLVHWLLSEADPTEVRGDAALTFPSKEVRDAVFEALPFLTDLHVQWQDQPNAPPLGAFLTEQALVKEFSRFGVAVCARIPRKPTTREPQSFAFVSMMEREDAERATKEKDIQVRLTPEWSVQLRPRLARFGSSTDRRVAIRIGEDPDWNFDWVHVSRVS